MDCISEKNIKNCSCTYTSCDKRGKCCLCVSYHRKNNEIPGCFFPKEVEKTYDRSFKKFAECYK